MGPLLRVMHACVQVRACNYEIMRLCDVLINSTASATIQSHGQCNLCAANSV
jgi:hypothetical protein